MHERKKEEPRRLLMRLWPVVLVASLLVGIEVAVRAADRLPAAAGDIEITPLIHATVQIEHAGKVILVDPWGVASGVKNADLILITESDGGGNGHHLDLNAQARFRKPGAPVVIPQSGVKYVPDGIVLANGESRTVAAVSIEAIRAHNPVGKPRPASDTNGYIVTLGGKRLYFAGVTDCVSEIRALKNIDVAFLPMSEPNGHMTPAAVAECAKAFKPKVMYVYHYDAYYPFRLADPAAVQPPMFAIPGGLTIPQTLQALQDAMRDEKSVELRIRDWYPARVE